MMCGDWDTGEYSKTKVLMIFSENIFGLKNTNMMQLHIYIYKVKDRKFSSKYLPFEKFPAKTPLTDFQESYD